MQVFLQKSNLFCKRSEMRQHLGSEMNDCLFQTGSGFESLGDHRPLALVDHVINFR